MAALAGDVPQLCDWVPRKKLYAPFKGFTAF